MAKETQFEPSLAKEMLAHRTTTETEDAYLRGDRRVEGAKMATHWAGYVTGKVTFNEKREMREGEPGWP